jgi:hypothetical protein
MTSKKSRPKPCQVRQLCLATSQKSPSAFFCYRPFFLSYLCICYCTHCKTVNTFSLSASQRASFFAYKPTSNDGQKKLIGVFTITMRIIYIYIYIYIYILISDCAIPIKEYIIISYQATNYLYTHTCQQ